MLSATCARSILISRLLGACKQWINNIVTAARGRDGGSWAAQAIGMHVISMFAAFCVWPQSHRPPGRGGGGGAFGAADTAHEILALYFATPNIFACMCVASSTLAFYIATEKAQGRRRCTKYMTGGTRRRFLFRQK